MRARERYAHAPMVLHIFIGQLAFIVAEHGIRVGLNARAAADKLAGDAASRRMTKHGRRRRKHRAA